METLRDARKVKAGDVKIGEKLRFLQINGINDPLKFVVKTITNITLSKSGKRVHIEADGESLENGAIGLNTLLHSGNQKKFWDEIEKERGIE
jgi:hypothetical protein